MIRKRIPLAASLKALFQVLTVYQTTTVYNKIPSDAVAPYIKICAFTCKPGGSKDVNISNITAQIQIFSTYDGELEVNSIADDVIQVIEADVAKLDLSADGFNVMEQSYDFFESFETEDGYTGIITFVAKIQNLGE
ncbi:tail completion protein gp17 [Pelosinus baikalensis]|uniref:DUF3168 domain-containing protein n=1 Tax=Pelosinus baikalensis TaxID=2892015 RepID=A0ABS8HQT5_9FIRM|nr:DUF3168 domain-containing protein [Pelosinus baikalensis]MCC5465543.1 DUF3168 domain-containing protein [Pelosinus baikalensis]